MDERVLASQKHEERLAAFWPRKVSRHITNVLIKTPVTANQATILWGIISVANSAAILTRAPDNGGMGIMPPLRLSASGWLLTRRRAFG